MKTVVAIIALSLVYATLTWPLVRRLEMRIPRALAIIAIDSSIAVVLVGLGFAAAPGLYAQAQAIVAALPAAGSALSAVLPSALAHWLAGTIAQINLGIAAYAREVLGAALILVRSLAALVGAIVVIPVLAAYFQLDAQRYSNALLAVVPKKWHARTRRAIIEVASSVGGAIRGQIIVSALVGTLVYIVLAAGGIPYAGIIATVTALCDVVPYLGGIAAFIPSLFFALAVGGVGRAVLVGLLLLAIFEFEAQFLAPQIVGRATRLAPSLIIVALLIGTALFGALGLFLAVPVAAVTAAALRGFYGVAVSSSSERQA